jgi:hypothetical protein
MTQEALIWSLAHTTRGALGEPIAKPALVDTFRRRQPDRQPDQQNNNRFSA